MSRRGLWRVVVRGYKNETRVYEGWYASASEAVFGVLRTIEGEDGMTCAPTISVDVTTLDDRRHRATPGLKRTL